MKERHLSLKAGYSRIRMWFIASVTYIILIFFVLYQGGKTSLMLLTMATILGLYWLASSFGGIRKVKGKRSLGGEAKMHFIAESRIPVELHIRVPGWMPIPYVGVSDELYRFGKRMYVQNGIVALNRERQAVVSYMTPPLSRGCYQFSNTCCFTKDLFGLFEYQGTFQAEQPVYVMPKILPIESWKQSRTWHGAFQLDHALSRDRRESTDLNGIREYAHGDKLSRVHWNATAKTGIMKSKQFEPEGLPPLVLVLDQSIFVYETSEQFETAVSVLASIAAYARSQQRRTMVVGLGEELVIWAEEAVRHESLPYRQWLASVDRERTVGSIQSEPLWMNKWSKYPELRKGGALVWISGRANRNELMQIAALSKRNWHGTYVHVNNQNAADLDHAATMAALLKYRYRYVGISELQQLPVKLGGIA